MQSIEIPLLNMKIIQSGRWEKTYLRQPCITEALSEGQASAGKIFAASADRYFSSQEKYEPARLEGQ